MNRSMSLEPDPLFAGTVSMNDSLALPGHSNVKSIHNMNDIRPQPFPGEAERILSRPVPELRGNFQQAVECRSPGQDQVGPVKTFEAA